MIIISSFSALAVLGCRVRRVAVEKSGVDGCGMRCPKNTTVHSAGMFETIQVLLARLGGHALVRSTS